MLAGGASDSSCDGSSSGGKVLASANVNPFALSYRRARGRLPSRPRDGRNNTAYEGGGAIVYMSSTGTTSLTNSTFMRPTTRSRMKSPLLAVATLSLVVLPRPHNPQAPEQSAGRRSRPTPALQAVGSTHRSSVRLDIPHLGGLEFTTTLALSRIRDDHCPLARCGGVVRRFAFLLRIALVSCGVFAWPSVHAEVYRCVGPDGKTTLQQVPCVGPVAGADVRGAEEALRNAGGDRELADTIRGCRGTDKESSNYSRCSAVLACNAKGYVNAELRGCLQRATMYFAEQQRAWEAAQRQQAIDNARLAAEMQEMVDKNNPRNYIAVGQVFSNGDFVKLIDTKYPGTEWYADKSVAIPFGGTYYLVQSEKVNNTDIPARYRVLSITRSSGRPDKKAMTVSGNPNYRPSPSGSLIGVLHRTLRRRA